MSYSEKLRDPRWQRKRLEIMQRDGFMCQACGDDEKNLHVHHEYYISGRDPWEYPLWSLRTLCEECHSERQDDRQSLKYWESLFDSIYEFAVSREIVVQWVAGDLITILKDEPDRFDAIWAYCRAKDTKRPSNSEQAVRDQALSSCICG